MTNTCIFTHFELFPRLILTHLYTTAFRYQIIPIINVSLSAPLLKMTTHFSRAAFSSLISAIITEAKLLFSFSWALLSFLSVVASPLADSFTILSKRPPPAHGLLLAAFHDADHWICLSAEYRLINAFTATINKTAERLLKLRSTARAAPNEDMQRREMWNYLCVFRVWKVVSLSLSWQSMM